MPGRADLPEPTAHSPEEVYEQARALPPQARATFLAEACRGDRRLEAELVSLLALAEPAERLFAELAGGTVPPAIGQQIGRCGASGSGSMRDRP